jgi:hypothetical protein
MNIIEERKTCERCGWSFRCPVAQADRFLCRACQSRAY